MAENLTHPPQAHAVHARRLAGAALSIIVCILMAIPASCLATDVPSAIVKVASH